MEILKDYLFYEDHTLWKFKRINLFMKITLFGHQVRHHRSRTCRNHDGWTHARIGHIQTHHHSGQLVSLTFS